MGHCGLLTRTFVSHSALVQAESEETKERLFESMLSECRDAIQAVREELKPDQVGLSAEPRHLLWAGLLLVCVSPSRGTDSQPPLALGVVTGS